MQRGTKRKNEGRGMSVLGRGDNDGSVDRTLLEDASLFICFVNAVNSSEYRRDEAFPHPKKRSQKIRFKTYNMNADSFMYEKRDDIAFEEDRNGFVCAHCDARYIYKRCLINHLIKSHRTDPNTFRALQ